MTDQIKPITNIASMLDLPMEHFEPYGHYAAKIGLDILETCKTRPQGKYVLVTAMTPTPFGEGKTTTAISLSQAFWKLNKRSAVALRQSSLGPTFGRKGGGSGGARASIAPLDRSILHLTGDMHAVSQAHNQLAAQTDNAWYHRDNPLNIDPAQIQIRRVLDVNDRFLRNITIGNGGKEHGIPRATGFDITPASEVMAILALLDGSSRAEVMHDLRTRLGRMVVAFDKDGKPVSAEDIKAAGAATAIMQDAVKPNLMQTIENTPVFIHAGPFANIAHGCSSILSDRIALAYSDVVVTEAGFGMDIGGEKFFDIKCRASKLRPDAVVVVATLRAMKAHAGRHVIRAGRGLPEEFIPENPELVREGGVNLIAQVQNAVRFGLPVVVAINAFPGDFESEYQVVRDLAREAGAKDCVVSRGFVAGGDGAVDLARAVLDACDDQAELKTLYDLGDSLTDKMQKIARTMYGANGVKLDDTAKVQVERFEAAGFGELPVCIAKTPLSLSANPAIVGAPKDYDFPIRSLRISAGAGFVYALAGNIMTMPGLGAEPAAFDVDIDENGNTTGIF